MHHKDLKIIENFKITGRGVVLVTELEGLHEGQKINIGDTVRYGQKTWEIKGVEGMRTSSINPRVGLLVQEISQKEIFCKLVTKEDSSLKKDIRWRVRNRWWIKIVQKVQLLLLSYGINKPRWVFEITKTLKK
jgi:hypothetical protein